MARPGFANAWSRFAEINLPVAQVGQKIGGKVQQNIVGGIFRNACPIRMSYVLNRTGTPIPSAGYHVVSGDDRRWYMFRVAEMMTFLERTFGTPDKVANASQPSDFNQMKGVLLVRGTGWSDALGHVTLWNGQLRSDSCPSLGRSRQRHVHPDSSKTMGAAVKVALAVVLLTAVGCASAAPLEKVSSDATVDQPSLLKDWALARCIAKGVGATTPAGQDAANAAAALLERSDYGIDAYEALEPLIDRQLIKPYGGSTGGTYTVLQCIDLFHGPALDRAVRALKPTPVAQ